LDLGRRGLNIKGQPFEEVKTIGDYAGFTISIFIFYYGSAQNVKHFKAHIAENSKSLNVLLTKRNKNSSGKSITSRSITKIRWQLLFLRLVSPERKNTIMKYVPKCREEQHGKLTTRNRKKGERKSCSCWLL
jgi:hypothetical protein